MITEDLIDRIYEAAAIPELWPAVLDQIAALNGAIGGQLFVSNAIYAGWTASDAMRPLFEDFIASGYASINPRPARALEREYTGFINDYDLFNDQEMDADPTYRYLRSSGPFARSVVRALEPLRPHLARASLISARLSLERARAAAQALDIIGLPAAVLSRSYRVSVTNKLFEALIPSMFKDGSSRVALADERADGLLKMTFEGMKHGKKHSLNSIPIRAGRTTPPSIVHVVPIARAANDIFSSACAILIVLPLAMKGSPPASIIQGLFDLTPAEARVAVQLSRGGTVADIASAAGIEIDTVRKHLKAVFAKTGVTRQSELIAILSSGMLRAASTANES